MDVDEYLRLDQLPDLRDPYLVAAFGGWNDAAQVATHTLTALVRAWSAEAFASIDPEHFFDFSETRPTVSLGESGQRPLTWPSNTFHWSRLPGDRDAVILIGTEPQLRWRTFSALILDVAQRVGASGLVTLGGLLADVPHTIEPRLTGFVQGHGLFPSMPELGLLQTAYEGPTGMIGVLHDAWTATGKPAVSIWGNVPHYISAAPNPQVALALMRRLGTIFSAPVPTSVLEAQVSAFRAQVDEALVDNEEAREYVQELEQQYVDESGPIAGPTLMAELEEFLRTKRPDSEEE
jgi:proteasome assembly chaperone (PAC2) family protein